MTMSLKAFNQLKKLMQLATSDSDHEALSALRKANSLLREAGVDWQRVFERCVTVGVEVEAAPEEIEPATGTERYTHAWFSRKITEAFEFLDHANLSQDFGKFIESLQKQFKERGTLSENQRAALFAAVEREKKR